MNAERGREAVEVIGVVGEQVGPFEALPFPDRIVDVNSAPARTTVGAPIRGLGLDAPVNISRDAAANVSHSRTHGSISPAQRADAR
jgi:hypothetical protein